MMENVALEVSREMIELKKLGVRVSDKQIAYPERTDHHTTNSGCA
jgi:hypothetical protein